MLPSASEEGVACRTVSDHTLLVEARPGEAGPSADAASPTDAAGTGPPPARTPNGKVGADREGPRRPSAAEVTELLQAAVSGAQRAQQLYRAKADEVRRLKAALRQRGEGEAHANVTTTGIRLNDRVLFVRSAGAAGRSERPYLAVRSDGGPPAFLAKASEKSLPAGGAAPELALGKVVHLSEFQSELCAAYGLPVGSTYTVVTAEMLDLPDPRSALHSRPK